MLSQFWYYFIVFIISFVSLTADGYPNIQLDSSTLKTANLFFRHGARSPLITVAKKAKFDDITWSEEPGFLTKVGKEKMFQLGLVLRERYKDFLSPYYVPGEIQVTTTPLERTSSSAKALLAGLYNTRGYTKWSEDIPVTVVPISTDYDVIDKSNVINSPTGCPLFRSEQRLAIEAARNQDNGFQDVYNYLSLYAGSKIDGLFDVFPTWEILECLAHNNRKLPDWASFVYPTRMSAINGKVLRALITGTKKMIRLTGGPYIGEVHKQFNDVVLNPAKQPKLIVHGGHDFSMTANLAALGILEKTVNPGDATILELHKIPFAGYFVQFLYIDSGGTAISTVPIKSCGHPCSLHKFLELTKDVIPKNWDIECGIYH